MAFSPFFEGLRLSGADGISLALDSLEATAQQLSFVKQEWLAFLGARAANSADRDE